MAVVVVFVALAIGIFYFSSSRNPRQAQPTQQTTPSQLSVTSTFDASDNLDQAIQDLNMIEK